MDETRIDNLETQFAELRAGQRAIEGRLCRIEAGLEQTASREEVAVMQARLGQTATREDIVAINGRLDQSATKADMNDLRVEMYRAIADLKTWVVATTIAITGVVLAAAFGLHHWSG